MKPIILLVSILSFSTAAVSFAGIDCKSTDGKITVSVTGYGGNQTFRKATVSESGEIVGTYDQVLYHQEATQSDVGLGPTNEWYQEFSEGRFNLTIGDATIGQQSYMNALADDGLTEITANDLDCK